MLSKEMSGPEPLAPVEERALRHYLVFYLLFLAVPVLDSLALGLRSSKGISFGFLVTGGILGALLLVGDLWGYLRTKQFVPSLWLLLPVLLVTAGIQGWLWEVRRGAWVNFDLVSGILVALAVVSLATVGFLPWRFFCHSLLPALDSRPEAERAVARGWTIPIVGIALVASLAGLSRVSPLAAVVGCMAIVVVSFFAGIVLAGGAGRLFSALGYLSQFFLAYDGRSPRRDGVVSPREPVTARQVAVFLLFISFFALLVHELRTMNPATLSPKPFGDLGLQVNWLVSVAIGTGLVLVLPGLSVLALYAPAVGGALRGIAGHESPALDEGLWESERRRHAPDYLYLGRFEDSHRPALLHRNLLDTGHAYYAGSTGSGKTARGMIPLLRQLADLRDEDGMPSPIIVIDAKGDHALAGVARRLARGEGRNQLNDGARRQDDFLPFTIKEELQSAYFNPFTDLRSTTSSVRGLGDTLVQALGLYHGDFYGASFFAGENRHALFEVLRKAANDPAESLAELYQQVQSSISSKGAGLKKQDTAELRNVLHAMTMLPQINAPIGGQPQIRFPEVIEKGHIAYFHLPSLHAPMTVSTVGRLALYSAVAAANDYTQRTGKKRRVYILIDEFQAVTSDNVKRLLEQARSYGVTLILSSQDPTNLDQEKGSKELYQAIMRDTVFQQFFDCKNTQVRKDLMDLSGLRMEYVASYDDGEGYSDGMAVMGETHGSSAKRGVRLQEKEVSKLNENDLNRVRGMTSLVFIGRDKGLTAFEGEFRHVEAPYSYSLDDYESFDDLRWWPAPAPEPQVVKEERKKKARILEDVLGPMMKAKEGDTSV